MVPPTCTSAGFCVVDDDTTLPMPPVTALAPLVVFFVVVPVVAFLVVAVDLDVGAVVPLVTTALAAVPPGPGLPLPTAVKVVASSGAAVVAVALLFFSPPPPPHAAAIMPTDTTAAVSASRRRWFAARTNPGDFMCDSPLAGQSLIRAS